MLSYAQCLCKAISTSISSLLVNTINFNMFKINLVIVHFCIFAAVYQNSCDAATTSPVRTIIGTATVDTASLVEVVDTITVAPQAGK